MATVLYAGHPYGYPSQGTVAGLTAITLDDVKLFYALHYTRDRLVVGVAGGYPEGFAEAFTRRFAALRPPRRAAAAPAAGAQARRQRDPDRREGRARQRDLDRAPAVDHARQQRLLSADRRALVPGRAPDLQRRADEPSARQPRPELRRLRLHRELHPGRLVDVSAAQHLAPPAALRDLAAPGAAAEQPVRAARRALRDRQVDPRGHPRGRVPGHQDLPDELRRSLDAGHLAPAGLRHGRRGRRQGPDSRAARAAAQDEEGRGRRGDHASTSASTSWRSPSSPTRAPSCARSWSTACRRRSPTTPRGRRRRS